MQTVEEEIRKFIAESIMFSSNGFPYADDISFLENGIVDSMNVMEIVMFVEENFQVSVQDADITPDNFDSVRNLANFIRRV